jgi:hypothetical protein
MLAQIASPCSGFPVYGKSRITRGTCPRSDAVLHDMSLDGTYTGGRRRAVGDGIPFAFVSGYDGPSRQDTPTCRACVSRSQPISYAFCLRGSSGQVGCATRWRTRADTTGDTCPPPPAPDSRRRNRCAENPIGNSNPIVGPGAASLWNGLRVKCEPWL